MSTSSSTLYTTPPVNNTPHLLVRNYLTTTPIIGRVLNHKTPEATKVYARLIVAPVRNAVEEATAAMRKIGEQ